MRYLVSRHFRTLREVANAVVRHELEFSISKDEEDVVKTTVKDKEKGKRYFGAFEQQAPQ